MSQRSNSVSEFILSAILGVGSLWSLLHIQKSYDDQQAAKKSTRVTERFGSDIIGVQEHDGKIEFVQAEWAPIRNMVPNSDAWMLDPSKVNYGIIGYRVISAEVAFIEMSGSTTPLIEEATREHNQDPRKVSPAQIAAALEPYVHGLAITGKLTLPAQTCLTAGQKER